MSMDEKVKPIRKIKAWPISAAIWGQEHEGRVFYNATFQRSYKKDDGSYGNSDSFGKDDLLLLAKVADRAHTAILELEYKARQVEARQVSPRVSGVRPGDPVDAEDDVPF
jgi:hypothetical protein